jgi:two-component system, sensor histidine kinase PdtaS
MITRSIASIATGEGAHTVGLRPPRASAMELFTPLPVSSASSLGIALVIASNTPLVLLDIDLNVKAASGSFCGAFGLDPRTVVGSDFFALGDGEWNIPQVRSLLGAIVAGRAGTEAYETDLVRTGMPTARLVLNAHEVIAGDGDKLWIVLAILDVTEVREQARQKAFLIREKEILLEELQHRIANSLQIIASVLMQSARTVQSDETRMYLNDAHHRVMSLATLERHLAEVRNGNASLRPYFNSLCASIAASMISKDDELTLVATIDESVASPSVSVSLGLIVTELTINALKHAFPGHPKKGSITVDYRSDGKSWALRISDNGVGMPPPSETPKAGLGTGIVEALAGQLDARVEVTFANPGTIVSILSAPHVEQAPV